MLRRLSMASAEIVLKLHADDVALIEAFIARLETIIALLHDMNAQQQAQTKPTGIGPFLNDDKETIYHAPPPQESDGE
jgi:hypothetical protein